MSEREDSKKHVARANFSPKNQEPQQRVLSTTLGQFGKN